MAPWTCEMPGCWDTTTERNTHTDATSHSEDGERHFSVETAQSKPSHVVLSAAVSTGCLICARSHIARAPQGVEAHLSVNPMAERN